MSDKILLVGGGGHCKSVLDSLLSTKQYAEIAVIDKEENIGGTILGVPILGSDSDLPKLYERGFKQAFITVGSVGNPSLRMKLYSDLEKIGFEIPNIIDKTAIISQHVKLEKGIFIGKNAVINAGSVIFKGAIINTSTLIEHDCIVGEFVHLAPGCVLCGEVSVGAETHIGANSVIKQQTEIGSKTVIGMGSVVIQDIKSNTIAFGHPCKEVSAK